MSDKNAARGLEGEVNKSAQAQKDNAAAANQKMSEVANPVPPATTLTPPEAQQGALPEHKPGGLKGLLHKLADDPRVRQKVGNAIGGAIDRGLGGVYSPIGGTIGSFINRGIGDVRSDVHNRVQNTLRPYEQPVQPVYPGVVAEQRQNRPSDRIQPQPVALDKLPLVAAPIAGKTADTAYGVQQHKTGDSHGNVASSGALEAPNPYPQHKAGEPVKLHDYHTGNYVSTTASGDASAPDKHEGPVSTGDAKPAAKTNDAKQEKDHPVYTPGKGIFHSKDGRVWGMDDKPEQ